MKTLLIASANRDKIQQIKHILQGIPYQIREYSDFLKIVEVEETGVSYAENARIKAETVGKKFRMWTIADDSGLEVDALGGRPGIYSARYAPGNDHDRIKKLLDELKDIPLEKRGARYRAVIALFDPKEDVIHTFSGTCEGRITFMPEGTQRFGYDPVFYSFDLRKTFGAATEEEKQQVSHRARALMLCRKYLKE